MYESNLEIPGRTEDFTDGRLAAIAWPDLVARLAAQNDLRRILLAGAASGRASFNATAAAMLADREDGKRVVNRDALANGKHPQANPVKAAAEAVAADREI